MAAVLTDTRRSPPAKDLAHASGDERLQMLDEHLKRLQHQQDTLIEVLHKAQELFGYLPDDLLLYVAHRLKLPPSRVYGVARFYHLFALKPHGEHTCVVCMGTACYVNGAARLLAALEEHSRIHAGQTTGDGKLSLSTARCLGTCGIAPIVVLDGVVAGHQTEASVLRPVEEWLGHGHR